MQSLRKILANGVSEKQFVCKYRQERRRRIFANTLAVHSLAEALFLDVSTVCDDLQTGV